VTLKVIDAKPSALFMVKPGELDRSQRVLATLN